MKAERSGLSETEQAVTEKAEEIKATEEKSVSSVVESVPKHETVHEVTVDRIAAVFQDAHRDQMMEEVEASTKTANETMKEADITTETGEYENVSKVGVEKASTPIAASTHESRQDATDDDGMSNTVSASVPLERGQPMTNQAETQKTQDFPQGLAMGIFAGSGRTWRWTCLVQVCASTGKSRMVLPTTTGSGRHDDRSNSFRMSASRSATDHEAHSHTQRGQLRAEAETRRSKADECTIAGSRAEQSLTRGAETPFAVQTFEAKTPTTRRSQRRAKVDHTWHGGIHDHADDKVANRALGSFISTQCLEGEESSSGWGCLPDHA